VVTGNRMALWAMVLGRAMGLIRRGRTWRESMTTCLADAPSKHTLMDLSTRPGASAREMIVHVQLGRLGNSWQAIRFRYG